MYHYEAACTGRMCRVVWDGPERACLSLVATPEAPRHPIEATATPAILVGHQAKLLKGACRLLLAYVRFRLGMFPSYAPLHEEVTRMDKLLNGPSNVNADIESAHS